MGQVANLADGWDDDATAVLGPELQLGQTDNPTQLIHGDPAAIRATVRKLREFSNAFARTAAGLADVDTSGWTGAAADVLQMLYAPQPGRWRDASTASSHAAGALEAFAGTVEWAQRQARKAIAVYSQGQGATQAAVTAYNQQMAAYNAAAEAYDSKLSSGRDPGPPPIRPQTSSDPGASLREKAQQILSAARAERDRAGSAAASAVSRATDMAPAAPRSFL